MRTNIDIDEKLIKKAMRIAGVTTKREAVERALELMVKQAEIEKLMRASRGKLPWEGDLEAMRLDRSAKE